MERTSTIVARTVALVFALTLASVPAAVAAPQADADPASHTCNLSTLTGRYASQISGWVKVGDDRLPYGATGNLVLDGHGNIRGRGVQTLDGVITTIDITGTYTVNQQRCTGRATSTIGTFFFAITENGNGTLIVGTTPGTTVTGHSVRQ